MCSSHLHRKKRFPELEKELLDTYYKFKGWNNDGIPTIESLKNLDLDYVAKDFLDRGILAGDENIPVENTLAQKKIHEVEGLNLEWQ